MVRRSTVNFVVDLLTLLAIFAMIATGLIIRFVLLPGTGGRHGEGGFLLWGLGRHDWGDVHFWASVALGVLLVVHVALHWSWVCTITQRLLGGTDAGQLGAGKRNAYGVGFLLVIVLAFSGFTWYAGTAVTQVNAPGAVQSRPAHAGEGMTRHGQHQDQTSGQEQIRGSMSLAEVEVATGVSVETLAAELGLPKNVSAKEQIGRLVRQHGFSMDNVRDAIAKHTSQPDKHNTKSSGQH